MSEALAELRIGQKTLAETLVDEAGPAAGPEDAPARAGEPERGVEDMWGALRDWLSAWGRLEDDPLGERARTVYARVFVEGALVLHNAFKDEWADSEARLLIMKREGLDAEIEALGGAPFLLALRKAHRAYGEALFAAGTRHAPVEPAGVREVLQATHDALRDYVMQVAASRRRAKPATIELAERLLYPLTRWGAGTRAAKKAEGLTLVPPLGRSKGG